MATTVTFNGSSYSIPANREPRGWGTSLSSFLVDVANSSLSKAGGTFTLTADANFGTSYGLVSKYIKYSAGQLTLNTSGTITVPNATDTLVGKATTDTLTNKTLTSPTITGTGAIAGTFTGNLTGNVTGNASTATLASTVTTNANLTGEVTSVGNAATLLNSAVIGKVLTGYVSGSGTVAATDTILQAVNKLNGNDALKAPLASPTFSGTITLATQTGFGGPQGVAPYLASSTYPTIGFNTYGTYKAGTTGYGVILQSDTTNGGLAFYASTASAATDASYTTANIGSFTKAGAWTLGPASSTNNNLTVNGQATVNAGLTGANSDALIVRNSAAVLSDSAGIRFQWNTGIPAAIRAVVTNAGTGANKLAFYTNDLSNIASTSGLVENGSVSNAGAWTLGVSGDASTNGHIVYGQDINLRAPAAGGSYTLWQGGTRKHSIGVDNAGPAGSGGLYFYGTSAYIGGASGTGAWTFPLIHNIGAGNITSGTYTPTVTLSTNCSASTAYVCMYSRVGNVVTVCGVVDVTVTTGANTDSLFKLSLPIATNMASSFGALGVLSRPSASGTASSTGVIYGDAATDIAFCSFNAAASGNGSCYVNFQYIVA